jgi:hypothetical protein
MGMRKCRRPSDFGVSEHEGKKQVVATSIEKMMIYRWMEWYDPVYTIL